MRLPGERRDMKGEVMVRVFDHGRSVCFSAIVETICVFMKTASPVIEKKYTRVKANG